MLSQSNTMTTDTPSSRDEEIPTPVNCPNCPNIGWFPIYDSDGDMEQQQCQFCYSEPNSIFNVINNLRSDLIRLSAEREKVMAIVGVRDGKYDPGIADGGKPGFTVNGTDFFGTAQQCLEETLAERDKELAKAEQRNVQNALDWGKEFKLRDELFAQLLAAQTVNGKMREALKLVAIYSESIGGQTDPSRINAIANDALALSPDPTLLDEVVSGLQWLLDSGESHEMRNRKIRQLLSRLRQSTRETEEKV